MNNLTIEKVKKLPPEKQQEVEDFIDYLLNKYEVRDQKEMELIAEQRRKNAGRFKGQIWMADDFNETPDDFKDYM
jgi:hypothetical protein